MDKTKTQELVREVLEGLENLSLKEDGGKVLERNGLEHHPFLGLIKNWFFTWLPKGVSLRETAPTVSSIVKNKFVNCSKEMMLQRLKYFSHDTITSHYVAVYCDLISGETSKEEVEDDLEKAMELVNEAVKNGFISLGMMEAYNYLHATVEALHLTKTMTESKVHNVLEHIRALTENEPENKTAVCTLEAAKSIFMGAFRQGKEEVEVLEGIVKMEPEELEWKILYLFGMRVGRRKERKGPTDKEREELEKCLEVGKGHPVVKLLTVGYLTDLVKDRDNQIRFPLRLKDVQFFKVEDVMDRVRVLAGEIMQDMAYSVKANLLLAECLTSGLPYKLKDYPSAKKYLKRALDINPHSSKANHKMGVALIFEKKFGEAEEFCKKAFETDKRNFPAILDYIQILLRDPKKNAAELKMIFKFYSENETWKGHEEAVISTYRGIWKFISGSKGRAVLIWLEANEKDGTEPVQEFRRLGEAQRRFQWDAGKVNVENFRKFLEDCLSNMDEDDPRLIALVKDLKTISTCGASNLWRGSDNGRGNRRGGGSSGNWRV